jgi:simple sugar transport system substrate-binding protein
MRARWMSVVLAGPLWVAVTSMATAGEPPAAERYVMVTHAADSDVWWNTVKNAIKEAGEDFGVAVDYHNPPNGDLADMGRLLEQAAARKYDGVAFDIADFDVLFRPAMRIAAKHIPLVTINSGTTEESRKLGAIMHIGQRCKGFADALGVDVRSSMIDSGVDPTVVGTKVSAYLRSHPGTQAILALGPNSAEPALQALQKMGLSGRIYFVTFDLSSTIVEAIRKGYINFAIDQQPYLQGYMAIAALAIAHEKHTLDAAAIIATLKANPRFQARLKTYGLTPVYTSEGVSSGPGFVTRDNVDVVARYAGQYR